VGIGDWGLGIGDWQSPIPNPQSPIKCIFILYILYITKVKQKQIFIYKFLSNLIQKNTEIKKLFNVKKVINKLFKTNMLYFYLHQLISQSKK